MKKYVLCAVALVFLGGCLGGGESGKADSPDAVLSTLSKALSNKDATLFLSQFDLPRYASAATKRMMQDVAPLGMLDSVGKSLGLGSIEGLVGLVTGTEDEVKNYFQRSVSTGELVQQCTSARTPDCPWVPQALTNAVIKELSPTTAVAGVTTPANIKSWLAFAKIGDVWKLVGAAALEQDAVRYAGASQTASPPAESATPQDAPAPPPAPSQNDAAPSHDEPAPPPPPNAVRL